MGLSQNDVILEIGCGIARVGKPLSTECLHWFGADISAGMLSHASKRLMGRENTTLVELATVGLQEFPRDAFDLVYCTIVFMHLFEWDRYRYVEEAFRVLRPGGRCYFDNFPLDSKHGWNVFTEGTRYPLDRRPAHIQHGLHPRGASASTSRRPDSSTFGSTTFRTNSSPQPAESRNSAMTPLRRPATVSVIVPVYNEIATVRAALEALAAKRIEGFDLQLIVVESNSTDGSRDIVLGYRGQRGVTVILEDSPKGKGHAVRAGLAAAKGDIILIQDADLEYDLGDYE